MKAGLPYPDLLQLTPREIALAVQAYEESAEDHHRVRLVEGYRLLALERMERPPSVVVFLDGRVRPVTDPEERRRLEEEHARRAAAAQLPGDGPPVGKVSPDREMSGVDGAPEAGSEAGGGLS